MEQGNSKSTSYFPDFAFPINTGSMKRDEFENSYSNYRNSRAQKCNRTIFVYGCEFVDALKNLTACQYDLFALLDMFRVVCNKLLLSQL